MTIRPSSRTAQTAEGPPYCGVDDAISSRDPGLWGSLAGVRDDESAGARLAAGVHIYTTARVSNLEPDLHSPVYRAAERRKSEHLRIMLVRQIVDATENGQMRADFVFRGKIHEAVILDVEIRRRSPETEIDSSRAFTHFASSVVRNFFHHRYERRNINFVARPSRQARAWQLRDVSGAKFSPCRDKCRSRPIPVGRVAAPAARLPLPVFALSPRFNVSKSPLNPIRFDRSL